MLRTRDLSTHNYPPFPQDHLHLQPLQPQFPKKFSPQRSMFETNPETCFVQPLSTHNYPPFPQDHLHLQPLQPQFLEYFNPQRSMFETNPETCFVHILCPPTATPLSPRIISICDPFNLNFQNISAHNVACLRLTLKHASYTTSVHPQLPPFPPRSSPSATPFQPQFLQYFSPQRSMFETNPETCFVHGRCPPTSTSLSPRVISICNPFNLDFFNISAHNEACLRLTLKHASYTASVHPRLPPFPPESSPSATPSTSISWIYQATAKHVRDDPWNMLRARPLSTHMYPPFPRPRRSTPHLAPLHLPPAPPSTPVHTPSRSLPSAILTPVHVRPHPVSLPPSSILTPVHTRPHPVSLPSIFHPHPRPRPSTPHLAPLHLPSTPPSTPVHTPSRSPPSSFHTTVHTRPHPVSFPPSSILTTVHTRPPCLAPSTFHPHPRPHPSTPHLAPLHLPSSPPSTPVHTPSRSPPSSILTTVHTRPHPVSLPPSSIHTTVHTCPHPVW